MATRQGANDTDDDIVWHVATEDIEAVIAALERALSAWPATMSKPHSLVRRLYVATHACARGVGAGGR
jgi:hypothetical protein